MFKWEFSQLITALKNLELIISQSLKLPSKAANPHNILTVSHPCNILTIDYILQTTATFNTYQTTRRPHKVWLFNITSKDQSNALLERNKLDIIKNPLMKTFYLCVVLMRCYSGTTPLITRFQTPPWIKLFCAVSLNTLYPLQGLTTTISSEKCFFLFPENAA